MGKQGSGFQAFEQDDFLQDLKNFDPLADNKNNDLDATDRKSVWQMQVQMKNEQQTKENNRMMIN